MCEVRETRDGGMLNCVRVRIRYFEGGEWSKDYCGATWCDGTKCGLPTLAIEKTEHIPALKIRGSQVAHGPAFQEFRQPWKGPIEYVPAVHVESCRKVYWM